jgi:RNA ligase
MNVSAVPTTRPVPAQRSAPQATTPAVALDAILDRALLAEMIEGGYVRAQTHPALPLSIYNYTEKAQYESVWNAVTLACRGLIVDADGGVLARPFRKFFNHGQPGAPALDLSAPAVVTDKLDGSLGILYPTPDGHAVATRGSFASDQALHATEVWRTQYADRFQPPAGHTLLFEIVYPGNRIVVDYGDLDDLVLLGVVEVVTGRSIPVAEAGWPGPIAELFGFASLAEALTAEPRPNCEGLVVHLVDNDERIKLKQEDYVALHRIVTGLTARTVWQHLVEGKELADLVEPLPDEFHPWVRQVADDLHATVERQAAEIALAYETVVASMPDGWTRKEFAAIAIQHDWKWALFKLLDGREIRPELLRHARPDAKTVSGRSYGEDTA